MCVNVQFHERLSLSLQDERLMAEKSLFSLLNTALMRRRCEASFFLYLIIKSFLRLLPFDFGVIHHSSFLDCGTQCFIHVEGSSYTLYVIVS